MHTTAEVARQFGVKVSDVNRWIRKGTIKALKLPSGHYRITDGEWLRLLVEVQEK